MVRIKHTKNVVRQKLQRTTVFACVTAVGFVGCIALTRVMLSHWTQIKPVVDRGSNATSFVNLLNRQPPLAKPVEPLSTVLLSRGPEVKVTADVRGNLGPPSVMTQQTPGTDWLKDRWQAASDMHGTAIPGVHWVELEFPWYVETISKVVLDWEAAFARDYRIEVSMDQQDWHVVFDSHVDSDRRTSTESGQSPGVTSKTPLHIVHTVTVLDHVVPFKYLRVYIRKSAMGWGVSLWQVDVYGTSTT
jgi:hypothetical protein